MNLIDTIWAKLLIAVLLAFTLAGCATMKNLLNNTDERAARVVITVAVVDITTKNPEYRERIVEITGSVRDYLSKEPEGRAKDIVTLVESQIKWDKLTPEQTLLVTTVLTAVELELEKRISAGGIDPESKLKVIQIIDWIEQAAKH